MPEMHIEAVAVCTGQDVGKLVGNARRRIIDAHELERCGIAPGPEHPRLLGIERHCFIYAIHRSGDQTFPLCQHTLQRPLQILSLEAGKAALRYIDAVVGYGHPVGKPDPAYLPERVSFRDFERGGLLPVCCNLAEADDAGARRSSLGKHLCREAVAIAICPEYISFAACVNKLNDACEAYEKEEEAEKNA